MRSDGLLRDDTEAAETLSKLVNAEVISTEEAVRWWRPDWTPEQVDEEVARITGGSLQGDQPISISTPRPPIPQISDQGPPEAEGQPPNLTG